MNKIQKTMIGIAVIIFGLSLLNSIVDPFKMNTLLILTIGMISTLISALLLIFALSED